MPSRAERSERLEQILAEWRHMFDAMTDSVALFDAVGTVRRANAATIALTGRGYDDIVGHSCQEVYGCRGRRLAGCLLKRSRRSLQTESRVMKHDGRWLRTTLRPLLDEDDDFLGGVYVVTDVSDLKEAQLRLLAITDGVIAAIGTTTEARDPYTAGHQRRVAELAAAIARELDQDYDRIEGVRVSAMLHDVGKINVPAEILSKPGRLTDVEFALIKTHARASHDILSPIGFPWPVAEAALQHHERLDGSGYPRCLSGAAVIPEARILAVADVVEAMSSHRPYREALGVEAALSEVQSGAGTRYDADVVSACEMVIVAGFRFETRKSPKGDCAVKGTG